MLANNALHWAHSIRTDNLVWLVYPDALAAPIHERDIAAVAVAAMRGVEQPAVLTGPKLITQRHQVELLALATGRPIRVQAALGRPPVPFAQWAAEHAADFS